MDQLEFKEIDLFTNMIGGHNYILKIGGGKLIKSVEKSEIEFYEKFSKTSTNGVHGVNEKELFKNQLKDDQQIEQIEQIGLFPKYYGYWNKLKNPDVFIIIEKFTEYVDNIFYEFILNLKQEEHEFIENFNYSCFTPDQANKSSEFKEKFLLFLNEKKNSNFVVDYSSNTSNLVEYKFNLNSLCNLNDKKLKWIIFWYIKKRKTLIKDDFVILEDLTYNMEFPAILDLKIGLINKISKKDKILKIIPESSLDLGFRIMGLQVNEIMKLIFFI